MSLSLPSKNTHRTSCCHHMLAARSAHPAAAERQQGASKHGQQHSRTGRPSRCPAWLLLWGSWHGRGAVQVSTPYWHITADPLHVQRCADHGHGTLSLLCPSCHACCRDWESHPACQQYTIAKRLGEVTRQHSTCSRDLPHGTGTDVRWLLTSGPDAEQLTLHRVLAAVRVCAHRAGSQRCTWRMTSCQARRSLSRWCS